MEASDIDTVVDVKSVNESITHLADGFCIQPTYTYIILIHQTLTEVRLLDYLLSLQR